MTVQPYRDSTGTPGATVCCDCCGAKVEVRVQHERTRGRADMVHTGNLNRKLTSMGWSATAAKQTCPACIAASRAKPQQEKTEMTAPTDIPQPSREQKREIMLLLQDVYDAKAQRYKGEESDQTVAATLNIGRWGWVSQIREEFFGPEGNEAKDNLVAEVRAKIKECDALGAKLHDEHDAIIRSLREFNDTKTQLVALLDRIQGKPAAQKPQLVAR